MIGAVRPEDACISTGPVWTRISLDASELDDALARVSELIAEARRILDNLPSGDVIVSRD